MEKPIDRIIRRLKELDIPRTRASMEAGHSEGFLSSIKNNNRDILSRHADEFAPILKTTPQWIMYGDDYDVEKAVEAQIRLDAKLLEDAHDMAKRHVIRFGLEDVEDRTPFFKIFAYYIEKLYRASNGLPPIREDEEEEI